MFSVPGWNVSAPLAAQVEKPKAKDPAAEGKKSKKRKRAAQPQVDEGNVGEYWEKIVEGKGKSEEEPAGPVKGSGANGEPVSEKKARKRRKKGDKTGKEEDAAAGTTDNEDTGKDITKPIQDTKKDNTKPPQDSSKDTTAPSKHEKKKKSKKDAKTSDSTPTLTTAPLPPTALLPPPKILTPLQRSMRAKLTSARFRHLNESLYTKPSSESLSIFQESPEMFEDYHRGFAQQVEVWPENPVDGYVDAILLRGKVQVKDPWKDKQRSEKKGGAKGVAKTDDDEVAPGIRVKPLPRNIKGHATIADLGCGTASLSHRLQPSLKQLNLTLHSFDLSKPTGPTAPLVTIADISALPLPSGSVDVAIFCLALMGTNWLDFIDEAWRILRWKGELWVSEIKSRFGRVERAKGKGPVNSVGSLRKVEKKGKKPKSAEIEEGPQDSADEAELATHVDGAEGKSGTDVSAFVAVLRSRGFVLDALPERQNDAIDMSNKMFVKMQFVKGAQPTKGKNVRAVEDKDKRGMRMGIKGKKYAAVVEEEDGEGDEKDAKVLKPCLYKIR